MQTAVVMAGFSMGEADTLRKVMGKKIREKVARRAREVRRRAPSRSGHDRRVGRGHVRVHRAVRRLRVQRLARLRLRLRRLPDRLPDGAPPGRVHGRDPHVGQGRQGSQALLPVRVPRDGHRGPASRRERVRHGLRARRPATAERSATGCRRCATSAAASCRASSRRARPAGRSRRSPTSAGGSSRPRSRSACSSRSSSPARSSRSGTPAAACCSRWASSRPSRRSSAPILAERKAEAAGQFSLFGGRGRRGLVEIDESVLGGRGARQAAPAVQGEGDARPVRDRPPAARRRGRSSRRRRHASDHGSRGPRRRRARRARRASSARSRGSSRSAGEPYAQFRLEGLDRRRRGRRVPRACSRRCPSCSSPTGSCSSTGRIDRRGRELQIRASEVQRADARAGTTGPGRARRGPAGRGVLARRARQAQDAARGLAGRGAGAACGSCPPQGVQPLSLGGVHRQRAGLVARRAASSARRRRRRGSSTRPSEPRPRYRSRDAVHAASRDRRDRRAARASTRPTGRAPVDAFGGDPLAAAAAVRRGRARAGCTSSTWTSRSAGRRPNLEVVRAHRGAARRDASRRAAGCARWSEVERLPRGRAPPAWWCSSAALADEDARRRDRSRGRGPARWCSGSRSRTGGSARGAPTRVDLDLMSTLGLAPRGRRAGASS